MTVDDPKVNDVLPGRAKRAPEKLWGPIHGGVRGWPSCHFLGDLEKTGYEEHEYFFTGEAATFDIVEDYREDGKWEVGIGDLYPYVTRLLIRRPADPARFNGVVIAEWANVSAGTDLSFLDTDRVYEGCAYALVSAQRVGVNGTGRDPEQGLKQWDPVRYGALDIPRNALCFDIFSQAGRLLGRQRASAGPDPLNGLVVERLLAVGASQSGACLLAYLNAFHADEAIFDGYLIAINGGLAVRLDDSLPAEPIPAIVRDDLAVPVLALNSETEVTWSRTSRQPPGPHYVGWEVAGASHITSDRFVMECALAERDGISFKWHPTPPPPSPPSAVSWRPVADAGIHHLIGWIQDGEPPPAMPLITTEGDPPAVQRDPHGNALGGIRTPDMLVPLARYSGAGSTKSGALLGTTVPFTSDEIERRYPTGRCYIAAVAAAAQAAAAEGVIREAGVGAYVAAAEARTGGGCHRPAMVDGAEAGC